MFRFVLDKLITAYFLCYDVYEINQVSFDSWFHYVLLVGALLLTVSLFVPRKLK